MKFDTLLLYRQILSLEIRKTLAYRVDFWFRFLGALLGEVGVAYFLWRAIFEYRGVETIGGYSFHGMMFYYLLVPLITHIVAGPGMDFMAREIYEGTLTRYLVYPVSFFGYKYTAHLAEALMAAVQLLAGLAVFGVVFGFPKEAAVSAGSVFAGLLTAFLATYLYFTVAACLELVAFWADNVWSLMVMLQFGVRLLGGGLIPLSLFPDWAQAILPCLPFTYFAAFPIRASMGLLRPDEWISGLSILTGWMVVLTVLRNWIWRRGTLQYTGVGM